MVKIRRPALHQAGHVRHRRAPAGRDRQDELGDRARLVDDQARDAVPRRMVEQGFKITLVVRERPREQPFPVVSGTSAEWDSLPTSRPTSTPTCSGVPTQAPSPASKNPL